MTDHTLTLWLDARDAVHKARRASKLLKVFNPAAYKAMVEIEDSLTVAINDHLSLRMAEAQKVAA